MYWLLFSITVHSTLSLYSNTWSVQTKDAINSTFLEHFFESHGIRYLGQIGNMPDKFMVKNQSLPVSSDNPDSTTEEFLKNIPWIITYTQQQVQERVKREYFLPTDPYFADMWYLFNIGQSSGPAGVDINVVPVWNQNITGRGVVISVLDDGIDYTHPDLRPNYDPLASYDFNDHDSDPKPRDDDPDNCHGTRCAGEVSAMANNDVCGVGVAFNSKVGGIRMLDGTATDALEASSLGFKNDYIDIYINCWGPKDDGKTYGKPGPLASRALEEGSRHGRRGLGSLYVWATGNGGLTDDDCNCDGYTTSIYTISIGCIGDHGLSAYYTEKCASTIAVTFNGASHREGKENKMVTTDLFHKCTTEFKGTSASAPIAAGIIALALEANPNLGWRDVQHLIVHTALITSPMDDGWKQNGANLHFNHKFGFGRLDALAMVEKAKTWTNVTPQRKCIGHSDNERTEISIKEHLVIRFTTNACANEPDDHMITKLEHVVLTVSLQHRRRGDLTILLTSPSQTTSQILSCRRYDNSEEGLDGWNFMSVHFWGENPYGTWQLTVINEGSSSKYHGDQADNEDLAEKMVDAVMVESRRKWDYLRAQNISYDFPYPPGIRRNKVTSQESTQSQNVKRTQSNMPRSFSSPLPGMRGAQKNNQHESSSFVFPQPNAESISPTTEETGTQRVQVSVGFENNEFRCITNKSCSGILLSWSVTFYGT